MTLTMTTRPPLPFLTGKYIRFRHFLKKTFVLDPYALGIHQLNFDRLHDTNEIFNILNGREENFL